MSSSREVFYLHPPSKERLVHISSHFSDREIHSDEVTWGMISMVDAEKRLLVSALEDPDNQPFVLLPERNDLWIGDLNETCFVGNVDEASRQLVKCTYGCLEKAIAIVKPGVRFREIGEIVNRHATMSELSVVRSYCGHGIGDLFHCAPNIPHYAKNKAVGVMKAGQTFTIEPMINAGLWRDRTWPDGWTAVTADAQFEHTLLVTETGVEVLTARLPSSPDVFPWLKK
uniref:Peptidase M24 domain-containing protein n=1 Tax=Brassica oleracea var. oleracea TaxID=109376 RepID=A0A0D3BQ16_BRAOL